jgi:hypothetical protein
LMSTGYITFFCKDVNSEGMPIPYLWKWVMMSIYRYARALD